MKKLLSILLLLVTFTVSAADKVAGGIDKATDKLSNGVSAVHSDITKATTAVYTDATEAVKTVYPDAKSTIETLYDDAKGVVNYLVPRIEGTLNSIAAALKVTASQVWIILIKKQVAVSITNSIVFLLIFIFIFFNVRYWLRLYKEDDFEFLETGDSFIVIIGVVLCIAGLIYFGKNLQETVNGFYVPEYGALKEVTEMTEKLLKAL